MMISRAISLLSIAAVFACPLWCGGGLCHVSSCCQGDGPLSVRASACCASSCCHRQDAPADSNDRPHDGPRKSTCQGVCGGAVFEKPVELNAADDCPWLVLAGDEISLADQFTDRPAQTADRLFMARGNYGRSMRTLHASLLC